MTDPDQRNIDQREQLVELLATHQNRLFGYIFALVYNRADAEDLFQETSLVLWRKFDQYEPGTNFVRWACSIAQFEVLNFQKRQRRSRLYFNEELLARLADVQGGLESPDDDARQAALASCLEQLGAADRSLIERCYGEEQSVADVAEQLGRPPRGIHNSLRRIRAALLQCIGRRMAREDA